MRTELAPTHVDVAIVGAGPVGAAFACALEGLGLEVVVLEARRASGAQPTMADARAIALSHGSRMILARLGAWDGPSVGEEIVASGPSARRPERSDETYQIDRRGASTAQHRNRDAQQVYSPTLSARGTTPIHTIHISQRGGFGRAELAAADLGVPALGYVVAYSDLYAALGARLEAGGSRVLTGAQVSAAAATAGYGMLRYTRNGAEHLLTARLVVLSEGGRALPAALRQDKDYAQSALVCEVTTTRPHAHRAFERFTPDGPIALLPLGDAYALVWTTPAAQVAKRLALDDDAFLTQLQAAFGTRQGDFTAAGPRAAYPLRLSLARASEHPRLLRIGNAAHVLHPVAGQGFNLGLRDAWKLAEAIADHLSHQTSARLGERHLPGYAEGRQRDVLGGSLITDLLVTGFGNDLAPLRQARGLALAALDLLPRVKTAFARKMMFGAQAW